MTPDEEDALVRVHRLCVHCGKLPLSVNQHGWCEGCEATRARLEAARPEPLRVGAAFLELCEQVGPRTCGVAGCGQPLRVTGFNLRRDRNEGEGSPERLFVHLLCPTPAHGRVERVG